MGMTKIPAYQCSCDICDAAAAAALDQTTAEQNATAAGFKTYAVPPSSPRAGAQVLMCAGCVAGVGGLG